MSREGDGFFDGAFFQFLCSTQKAEPDDSPGSQRADDESVTLTDADGFEVDIVEVAQARKEAPAREVPRDGVLGDYGLGAYGGYPRRSKARTRTRRVSIDLFVAVRGASQLVWYDNDGRCDFDKYVISDEADGAYTVFATDLDGDGDIDVIGANKDGGEIPWYENDGAMGFDEHMVSTTADGVRYVVASDMDGDADLDVLAALADADATVWYENGCDNQDYAPATTLLAMGLDPDALPESYYTT
jgi:hypothetical protein